MNNAGTTPVIIDTDPGIDDAAAILLALACPQFEILGITTVAGNIGIETTTRNAGRLLAFAGRPDIPVISGAPAPLTRQGFDELAIHGGDGLGGVAFPEPAAEAKDDAVQWLARNLMQHPERRIDILALGPLTNIALLVRDFPEAARRIRRIIAMGGAIHEKGNVGPRSEFNIAIDPEAADIVFRSGIALTLIPLDVTRRVRADRPYLTTLEALKTPSATATYALVSAYFTATETRQSRPLHDPCVILYALRPELFGIEVLPVAVDLGATKDAGTLVVDQANGTPISVALEVDGPGVLALLAERLG